MLKGLHHIAILASNRAETLAFYEALGFVVLELFISAGNPPRASFPEAYGLRHVAFRVEDASAARETLIRKGYAPQELRHDTFTGDAMFFVMDPDGLPIEIHE